MRSVFVFMILASAAVHAQDPDGGVPDVTAPPADHAQELALMDGRVGALEEQFLEAKSAVEAFTRLKFTGYIQSQYVYAENSDTGVDLRGNPAVKDGFSVRRGRLKATYTGTLSEYMLEVDWTGRAAELRSAEASFTEPFTGQNLQFSIGQMKWPFGHEVFQSSGDREFPERSRVIRSFFPGERDRGARITWKRGHYSVTAGAFDGNSIQNQGFIGVDNDREKDLAARVTFDFDWIAGGVSGLYGKTFVRGVYDVTPARPGHYAPRDRLGADLQLYLSPLPFGGTAIKGEIVTGHSYWSSGVERAGTPAMGWYAMIVQSIGAHEEAGVRFDYFDPAMGTPNGALSTNPIATLNLAYTHHFDDLVKLVVSYEFIRTLPGPDPLTSADPADDLFTLRLQARF